MKHKCGTVSGENKSIMYKGLDFKTFPSTTILIIEYGPLNAPFWSNYIYKNVIDSCQTVKQNWIIKSYFLPRQVTASLQEPCRLKWRDQPWGVCFASASFSVLLKVTFFERLVDCASCCLVITENFRIKEKRALRETNLKAFHLAPPYKMRCLS